MSEIRELLGEIWKHGFDAEHSNGFEFCNQLIHADFLLDDLEQKVAELEALLRELKPQIANSSVPFHYVGKIEKALEGKGDE